MEFLLRLIEKIMKEHRRLKRLYKIFFVMACVVVFITTYALTLPAITLEKTIARSMPGINWYASAAMDPEAASVKEEAEPEVSGESEAAAEENQGADDQKAAAEEEPQDTVSVTDQDAEENSAEAEETSHTQETDSEQETASGQASSEQESGAGLTSAEEGNSAAPAQAAETELITEDTELTASGSDYTVHVTVSLNSRLPKDTKLQVREITEENDPEEYQRYYEKAQKELQSQYDDNTSLSFARFYDISFISKGEKVEPAGNVTVRIEYDRAVRMEANASVDTIHFDEKKAEQPELIESEMKTEDGQSIRTKSGSDAGERNVAKVSAADGNAVRVSEVEFKSDSFSVFGIVGTTIEKVVLASDGNNYRIRATYGSATGIPEDAQLEIEEVTPGSEAYASYVAKAERALGMEEGRAGYIRVFDIKIVDPDDHSVRYQPAEGTAVDMEIELADASSDSLSVVHFADGGDQGDVLDNKAERGENGLVVTFSAEGFSIYVVGEEGDESDNARIGYRFWYNDGSQNILLSTQYFRYKDVHPTGSTQALTINEPSIPGVDSATWNRIFKGWSKTSFTDDDANLISVEVLNTELAGLAESEFVEGTYTDLYANLENVYYVTYVDINPNNVLTTEIIPVADSGTTTFTIDTETELRPSIDSDTELLGWYQISEPDTVYAPGQENVPIDSNITLYPKVEGGSWLIFNDNDLVDDGSGKMVSGGASFTPPAFYLGTTTEEPADPVWAGYEFGGWYTTPDCTDGTEFEFGGTLTHDTTVYAKWTPSDSACRVIIWKQRTSDAPGIADADKTYDYVTSYLLDDVVTGEKVNLDPSYTRIYGYNGTSTDPDKAYFMYNANRTDQSVIVKADGSSVLNVYYDRKPVTLNYYTYDYRYTETTGTGGTQYGYYNGEYVQLYRNGGTWYRTRTWDWGYEYSDPYYGTRYTRSNNRSWQLYKSFTGLYGSTLAQNGYTWPTEYNWYDTGNGNGTTGGTRTTFMAAFLPSGEDTSGSSITVNFYGSDPSGTRHIHFLVENLDGTYTERDNVATTGGSFSITDKYDGYHASYYQVDTRNPVALGEKDSAGYYARSISYNNNLYIYFDLNEETLTFYTNNGSNQLINYSVPFSSSLSEYSGQNPGQKAGYYFDGWFADPSCSEAFDFTQTMPNNNVAVYGKWKMRRVRVVIEPGAKNVYMGSQASTFRLDYDERIDGGMLESATRAGYKLDGWYTDPEFTNRFLFTSPINDDTPDVSWDYQDSARWAAARAAYGDDAENYDNVRGILHLYAKWIPDTDTRGINVEYDPGDAAIYDSLGNLLTTVPIDTHMYGFDGTSTTREAPSNYSDMYTFKYWEAKLNNGSTKIFYPSDPISLEELMPTDTIYDETGEEVLRQTVTLRAVYDMTGDPTRQTEITYDGNTFSDTLYDGRVVEMRGKTSDGTDSVTVTLEKEVNQNIELPSADDFYLEGWELVGWSFTEGTYEEQVAAATEKAPNFEPGQMVAADNLVVSDLNDDGNTLYAMWQPKKYTVTVNQVIEDGVPVHNFAYPYKTGVERDIESKTEIVQSLTGNTHFTVEDFEYYGRVGHVIRIATPEIPETAPYSVRVNAVVTKDDGTTEILNPTAAGDYQILGDVVITYTYSLKVPVKLQKRDATDHGTVLTEADLAVVPVEFNPSTNHWEIAGAGITLTIDSPTLERYLQEGTYKITEVTPPDGYASIGTDLYLTVRQDGPFTLFTASGAVVSEDIAQLDGTGKILTIYDNPIRTVTLTKLVSDEREGSFTFTATLFKNDGTTRLGNYVVGEIDGTPLVTNNVGEVVVALSHGESVDLEIPDGCKLSVTETLNTNYTVNYSWNGAEPADGNVFGETPVEVTEDSTLVFTNTPKKASVTIIKNVTGTETDMDTAYSFTATGLTASADTFELFGRHKDGEGDVSEQSNEKVYANILYGTSFSIEEEGNAAFDTTIEIVRADGRTETVSGNNTGRLILDGDVTITYTNTRSRYPVAIYKTGLGENETISSGATFALYKASEFDDAAGRPRSGAQIIAEGTTNENGILILGELPIETGAEYTEYRLVETDPPTGYNPLESPVQITVYRDRVKAMQGAPSIMKDAKDFEDITDKMTAVIRVWNNPGVLLPNSGGPGTGLFTIAGLLLIAAAGGIFYIKYRKKEVRFG